MPKRKKNKKIFTKKRLIIASIVVLLILTIGYLINIQVSFLVRDELHVELTPTYSRTATENNGTVLLNFTIKNNNFWFCNSHCSLSLYDPYTRKYIFKDNEKTMKSNTEAELNIPIKLNVKGTGQRLFYLEAECNNVRGGLCVTKESIVARSALAVVDYTLTASEQRKVPELKDKLSIYADAMNNVEALIANNKNILNDINGSIFDVSKVSIDKVEQLKEELVIAQTTWKSELYEEIKVNSIEELNSIVENQKSTNEELLSKVGLYNSIIETIDNIQIENITDVDIAEEIEVISATLQNVRYPNVERIYSRILHLSNISKKLIEENNRKRQLLEQMTIEYIDANTILINKLSRLFNSTGNTCSDIKIIDAKLNRNVTHSVSGEVISGFKHSLQDENATVEIEKDKVIINGTINVTNVWNYSLSDFYQLLTFDDSRTDELVSFHCTNKTNNISVNIVDNKPIIISNATSAVEQVAFDSNLAKCCIAGQCNTCSMEKVPYPTLLLHGHLMNKDNPIEQSLSSFAKMQKKLSIEKDMINGGQLDLQRTQLDGYWTGMSEPIVFRASYYYLTYYDLEFSTALARKKESIETYAIRLRELIDIVKTHTGAEKVNIVAHSMGGLVAREYLLLFGENNVENLILVGSPNNGVKGRVMGLCDTFGAEKECLEMSEGSIFLKKLNQFTPKSTNVVMIYGTGCSLDGEDGDGVVTVANAKLEYARNIQINGTCDDYFGVGLHSDMLNPEKHSEVYETIAELLQ
jgi:hypothetical protein